MNAKHPTSPLAMAISFMDCINRGDVDGQVALMHEDHELCIFDEPPTVGREANTPGWRGYAASFPDYLIHPHRMAVVGGHGRHRRPHNGLPPQPPG